MVLELLLILLPTHTVNVEELGDLNNRGQALHTQGRFLTAAAHLERACRSAQHHFGLPHPLTRRICGNLAATRGALGEWARSWQIYQSVLSPDSSPNQLLNAALAARLAGETRHSFALFARVKALPGLSLSQQAIFYENYAQLLWEVGQPKQAHHYWRQSEALLPKLPALFPTAALTRAAVAIQEHKPRLARRWLAQLNGLPDNLATRHMLLAAWTDFEEGKLDTAAAVLEKLPPLTGAALAEAVCLRARLLVKRKQPDAAMAYLSTAIPALQQSLSPTSPLLRQALTLWAQLLRQAEDYASANQLEQQLAQSDWQGIIAAASLQRSGGVASRR